MDALNPQPSFVAQHNLRLFNASGTTYRVRTRAGSIVRGWVADPNVQPVNKYFCHGHTLGTYKSYGYSVFSGADLQTVLRDEFLLVGSVHNGRPNDVVVWYGVHHDQLHPDHSALLVSVASKGNGVADAAGTILSSKNGGFTPVGSYSLAFLIQTYGDKYAVFRRP